MQNNKAAPSSVALAVITYYPKWYRGRLRSIKHTDKVRGDLALEFFRKATNFGYQTIVADGISSKTFRKELSKIPNLIIIKRRSNKALPAKKKAVKKAASINGVKAIFMTEAEKISLLDFIPKLVDPILKKKADIVIPEREVNLFLKTYPNYMYESENEGNKLYNDVLRLNSLWKEPKDLDLFFGPRVFANKKSIIKFFTRNYRLRIGKSFYLDNFVGQESYTMQFLPVISALKKRIRVVAIKIPFKYPKIQKENEEKGVKELFEEKRKNQRMGILIELLYFLQD